MLALTAIMVLSALGGYLLVRGDGPAVEPEPEAAAPMLMSSLVTLIFGGLSFGAGIFAYVVVLVTNAFTFNFNKPFWKSMKTKLWFFNTGILVFVALGFGFAGQAFAGPILQGLGLPASLSHLVPLLGALLVTQAAMVLVNLWAPVEKASVQRRLASYGVSARDIDGGWLVGISDPEKSSFKKLTMIEEDLGMLWFRGDQLIYRGDTQAFEMRRDDFLEVERATDAGSALAYGGVVDLILRFRTEDGAERRVRLHATSSWHLGAVKKTLDALAVRLNAWLQPLPAASEPTAPAAPAPAAPRPAAR